MHVCARTQSGDGGSHLLGVYLIVFVGRFTPSSHYFADAQSVVAALLILKIAPAPKMFADDKK